ncbi:MAG TPA: VCBS repeat-containing protein, partial [Thermoanaerobaculia bacterium]|nr:VCBS repeat-containing protein [Thermoanaerobaculia bacterium]
PAGQPGTEAGFELEIRDAATGELLRQVELPGAENHFPHMSDNFSPNVRVFDLDADGYDEVLVTYAHVPYWPSFTVLYEPRIERARSIFVASGHHHPHAAVDLDGDGSRELLFLGIANRMGWHTAVAAVAVTPPVNQAGGQPEAADTPDRGHVYLQQNPLHWYALLSRQLNDSDPLQNLSVDHEKRRIVVTSDQEAVALAFDGFPADVVSHLSPEERNRRRWHAYRLLPEAQRLARAGFAERALESFDRASDLASQADHPHLADWCERLTLGVLAKLGRFDDLERRAGSLASGDESSEVSFAAALALYLAGEPARAAEWFEQGMGLDGSERYGRAKYEHADGLAFSLVELDRDEELIRKLRRYAAAYSTDSGSPWPHADVLTRYLDWRRGRPLPTPGELRGNEEPGHHVDLQRFLVLEQHLSAGTDADLLLVHVEREIERSSETLPALLSTRALLLDRLGRRDEAAAVARQALELTETRRGEDMYARALGPVVAERHAAITGDGAGESNRPLSARRERGADR